MPIAGHHEIFSYERLNAISTGDQNATFRRVAEAHLFE
jgi:hypothetical protein